MTDAEQWPAVPTVDSVRMLLYGQKPVPETLEDRANLVAFLRHLLMENDCELNSQGSHGKGFWVVGSETDDKGWRAHHDDFSLNHMKFRDDTEEYSGIHRSNGETVWRLRHYPDGRIETFIKDRETGKYQLASITSFVKSEIGNPRYTLIERSTHFLVTRRNHQDVRVVPQTMWRKILRAISERVKSF